MLHKHLFNIFFIYISLLITQENFNELKVNESRYKQFGVIPHFSIEKTSIENLLKKY